MNKQELSQLRYLGKEIELIKKQINDAQYGFSYRDGITTDAVVGSDIGFPYTQHSIQIAGVRTDGYEKRIKRLRGNAEATGHCD